MAETTKPDAQQDPRAKTPEAPAFTQVEAYRLIDTASNLMTLERKMGEQVRAYTKEHGYTEAQASEYISYLNGETGQPAWVTQPKDGKKPSDSREIFELEQFKSELKNVRDAFMLEINAYNALPKKPEGAPQALSANNGIGAMRAVLVKPEHTAAEAIIAMLNGTSDTPATANFLIGTGTGGKDMVAGAWINSQNLLETAGRLADKAKDGALGVVDSIKKAGASAYDKAKAALSGDKSAEGTETAEEGQEDGKSGWGKTWDWMKEKWGALAGAGGVGALFYMIGNSLAGNSFIGKIIGVMAGVLGAVLGFKFFGGQSNSDLPQYQAQGQGPRYPGVMQNPMTQQIHEAATSGHPSYLRYENRSVSAYDLNSNGIIDNGAEFERYRGDKLNGILQNGLEYAQMTGEDPLTPVCMTGIQETGCRPARILPRR